MSSARFRSEVLEAIQRGSKDQAMARHIIKQKIDESIENVQKLRSGVDLGCTDFYRPSNAGMNALKKQRKKTVEMNSLPIF